MKKLIFLLSVFIGMMPIVVNADNTKNYNLDAKAGIAIDINSGKILYEKNSKQKLPVASVTKILSMYIVLEEINSGKLKWEDEVVISKNAYDLTLNENASNIYLDEGGKYTVRELFDAAMIQSANSATIALAEKISGSEQKFVEKMRKTAKSFGVKDAKIVNSTGLNSEVLEEDSDSKNKKIDDNEFSARDVALISYYTLTRYPEILEVTKKTTETFDKGGSNEQELHTYNEMLEGMEYERRGVDGLKTGTTDSAGQCFVGTTYQDNYRIITVVLNASNSDTNPNARFDATNKLMDYVYGNWQAKEIVKKGQSIKGFKTIDVSNGKKDKVNVVAADDTRIVMPKKMAVKDLQINYLGSSVQAPIKRNQKLTSLIIKENDKLGYLIDSSGQAVDMVAKESVKARGK
ncbi:hypothetical protein BG262_00530 [Floricoccus penangensis]|uniref:serine-type D-Ala-D-Ala carboxypeptidase n=1 Tax=Floricoccus penangensis TaxID=1859475 RepID=A0A9Q5JIN3_9LACT|nr:D-alanyl-D-alanine carboxypeptidase family protein [Floricoccus penangensis]OFI48020.1 hypothetical protein BG262_00530 [Floricoccus penangensis]